MSKLMKLAEEFNVAVFITNQVVSDPGGGSMFVSGKFSVYVTGYECLVLIRTRPKEAYWGTHYRACVN